MFLSRIRVNDFRVLKNVDLQFEKNTQKKIFPLGSYNGGGKSTLLQLIFILLHCSKKKNRVDFLKNLLKSVSLSSSDISKELLYLEIFDEEEKLPFKITFLTCNSNFLTPLKEQIDGKYSDFVSFTMLQKAESIKQIISPKEKNLKIFSHLLESLIKIENIENPKEKANEIQQFFLNLRDDDQIFREIKTRNPRLFRELTDFPVFIEKDRIVNRDPLTSLNKLKQLLEGFQIEYNFEFKKNKTDYEIFSYISDEILKFLADSNFVYITSFTNDDKSDDSNCLLCKIETDKSTLNVDDSIQLLDKLSNRVYLAAPLTQVFLFLDYDQKNLLFQRKKGNHNSSENYFSVLENTKKKLKGLFTYDFLAVDYILEEFQKARNEDFKVAVTSSSGEYGNNYKTLLQKLNQILEGKALSLDPDITGVNFKFKLNDKEFKELQPEDLSHGELKRLSIFMWIKHMNIQSSIVLMDEIEIAFHPDWQYLIVRDLEQWGQENQYILATHSYELCQAVTPKEVKDLTPFKKNIEKF